jgi:GNAT superfamily N-acetyltransferase
MENTGSVIICLYYQVERIQYFLSKSYWANQRGRDIIELSIKNSLCYGIYRNGEQIGFARAVTDMATMYWLADVFIDGAHRGRGLGKMMVKCIVESDELRGLLGILRTKDAHGLYERYGFVKDGERFMGRKPQGQ